jgi:predicted nucleotidyltransferase
MKCDKGIVDELVRRILEVVSPVRIILFGSAAQGQMGVNSDLDVLVVMPDGTHRRNTSKELYRRLYGFGLAKDIVVATTTDLEKHRNNPGLVYQKALNEGKVLYYVGQ